MFCFPTICEDVNNEAPVLSFWPLGPSGGQKVQNIYYAVNYVYAYAVCSFVIRLNTNFIYKSRLLDSLDSLLRIE